MAYGATYRPYTGLDRSRRYRHARRWVRNNVSWPGWLPRPPLRLVVLVGVVLLLGGLVSFARLNEARSQLEQARADLLAAQTAVKEVRGDDALALLDDAERHMAASSDAASSFPLSLIRAVPVLGSPVKAASTAALAGGDIVAAGRVLASAAESFPTSGSVAVDGHDLSAFHAAAVDSDAALAEASVHLQRAAARLDGPSGALLPMVSSPARSVAGLVDDALAQVEGAEKGLTLLADLTGPDTEARILLLSQDTMELRATGGFIGSFGVIRFSHGTVELERYDSFDALPPPEPAMEPPVELGRVLPRWWGLSNVNWWPDFPYTARTAQEMFRRQGGGSVDGVVAITEDVMARLIGVVGPLTVPGYAEPIAEEGFADRVLYEVELKRPSDVPKKKFLITLSEMMFDELFNLPATDVGAAVNAVDRSVRSGEIQAWFADPARQDLLGETAWSGQLPEPRQDFLLLVDSNMTASKANRDLVRDATYRVARDERGRIVGRLDVRYRNDGSVSAENPYYNGILRVYVPAEAVLAEQDGRQTDEGLAPDGEFRVFSAEVVVSAGDETSISFTYLLPDRVAPDSDYHLDWMRQTGTADDHLRVVVRGEATELSATDRLTSVERALPRNRVAEFLRSRWLFD